MALCRRFGFEFGKAKIGVDSSLVIAGIISSLVFMGTVQGIREGTVVAALLVGYFVRFFNRIITLPQAILPREPHGEQSVTPQPQPCATSATTVVTISRELGSGGHEIGKRVAQRLGVPFYDQQLIQLSAEQGGFTLDYIRDHEQQLAHSLFYTLYEQNYAYVDEQLPPLDALFMVQSKIIRDIADRESCVIVGRCADFVLKDSANCLSVFIHADRSFRTQRIMKRDHVGKNDAVNMLEDSDRKRTNYCRHFTGRQWGQAGQYNLSVESSFFGLDQITDMIVQAFQQRAKPQKARRAS